MHLKIREERKPTIRQPRPGIISDPFSKSRVNDLLYQTIIFSAILVTILTSEICLCQHTDQFDPITSSMLSDNNT